MASLMDLIQDQYNEGPAGMLSQSMGARDPKSTTVASEPNASFNIFAPAKNASFPEGLNALSEKQEKEHDGSVQNDIIGILSNSPSISNNLVMNEAEILKLVSCNKQETVFEAVSKSCRLDKSSFMALLIKMTSSLMGRSGKQKRSNNLHNSRIFDLLVQNKNKKSEQLARPNLIERLSDQDIDGNMIYNLYQSGIRSICKFFQRKGNFLNRHASAYEYVLIKQLSFLKF